MVEKKICKRAVIRGDNVRECPFGLPIPESCENAGEAIHRMAVTEGSDKLKRANRLVYAYHKEHKECRYADKILVEFKKVDCDFGDTAEGKKSTPFRGSPLFPRTFHGVGLDGIYGYPLGFYSDNSQSRNMFFGLFSLLGSNTIEEFIKLADRYDKCGEKEKANILDNLLDKLKKIKEEYKETFGKVEKYLKEYRATYENKRGDMGMLRRMTDAWYGPRQTNR
ncbi:hypothetical protein LCGC14_1522280 [marine sediment metagenome]|uniref:Uncharacterized protein n=1 Tax=marine sediment metagenome TaxID=412755 RepID=A0A0F9LZC8_9ZZZZ